MRHLKAGRKLGREAAHRKALFRNMVTSLIQRERIRTTLAKAKELRKHAEKTITLGKKGTLHARRRALRVIRGKEAFVKLFGPLSERYAERPGGYTRIIKIGNRRGDDAPMAILELVGGPQDTAAGKSTETKKKGKPQKASGAKKAPAKPKAAQKTKTEAKPKKEKTGAPEKKATPKKPAAKKKKDGDKGG
ncbi:MAG: 50S ribosomal protein L17 [Nitrospinaceae bacterium]